MIERQTSYILPAIILSFSFLVAGYLISNGIKQIMPDNRYVVVKGLAEREVKADLAIWPITIKIVGDDLNVISKQIESNAQEVKKFLSSQGFKDEESELGSYVVTDLLTNTYRSSNIETGRYIAQVTIVLKTTDVDLVKTAASKQYLLVQKGVIFGGTSDSEGSSPLYLLTKFNDLKPLMLSEAISNARKAAEQFAIDSSSRIGKLKTANQGSFVITPLDGIDNYAMAGEQKAINKKIRVVTTLEYFLEE